MFVKGFTKIAVSSKLHLSAARSRAARLTKLIKDKKTGHNERILATHARIYPHSVMSTIKSRHKYRSLYTGETVARDPAKTLARSNFPEWYPSQKKKTKD